MKWEASFKTKSSGKLWWQTCEAATNSEAIKKLTEQVAGAGKKKYNLYGGPFPVKEKSCQQK